MQLFEYLEPDFSFSDVRGSLFQLARRGYEQINVLTTRQGVTRGGHYHRETSEAFFVISGQLKVTFESGAMRQTQCFQSGDFFRIPALVCHTMFFIEDTVMVAMYERTVERPNGVKDIFPVGMECDGLRKAEPDAGRPVGPSAAGGCYGYRNRHEEG